MELEVLLTDGLLRYAWDMRFSNEHWHDPSIFPKRTKAQEKREILQARMLMAMREGLQGDVKAFVEKLPPHHPQYAKLLEGLKEYRALQEKGGWKKVRKSHIRKGSKHKSVTQLKERLAFEGYYQPTAEETEGFNEHYGPVLEKAVTLYQETHQLRVEGKPTKSFWKSINVPIEDRVEQIEVTIQRWRESRIGNDERYVHVNIPDFHAEAWDKGEREIRFRVVTGNSKRGCHRKKKVMTYLNATPLFSDEIEAVIINPYWNVPERIWKEEIIPEVIENENYYEENGYECVAAGANECARLRQKAGEGNALGQVKFIFPNKHSVYMHDTPKKHIFKFPVRAYSHGCMRVHEPLKFAEYLLKKDNNWNEREFEKRIKSGEENGVRLDTKVPIHIEYYTTRIDDQGKVNFLADVYRYDRARMGGKVPKERKCEPEPYVEIPEEPESQPASGLAEGETPEGGAVEGGTAEGVPTEGAGTTPGTTPPKEGVTPPTKIKEDAPPKTKTPNPVKTDLGAVKKSKTENQPVLRRIKLPEGKAPVNGEAKR